MKSVVETLAPTRVRLAVEVPFAELEPNITSAYKRISSQIAVPGFRKGKVPAPVIDQRVGRPVVLEEAVNEALPTLYQQAVRENELQPLAQPEVDVSKFDDGEDLAFTAEITVRPEITLPDWEGMSIQVDDAVVSDETVNERLETLRERFGTLVGVERAAADGDFVQIDLNATSGGEPVEGGQATGVSYQIGRGNMVEGLDDAVIGLSAGEKATFKTTLVGTREGEKVDCEVAVTAVKEQQLPEVDDEFAQLASEFDTLGELKEDLRKQAAGDARNTQAMAARDKALDGLVEMVGDVPVPDDLVEQQVEQHFSDGHSDSDEHRTEFAEQLRKDMVKQFVLDEIAKSQKFDISQDELSSYIMQQAMQARVDPNQLAQQLVDQGQLPSVAADIARGKALALVVEKANVTDASGNVVDLGPKAAEENSEAEGSQGAAAAAAESFEFAEIDDDASDQDNRETQSK